MEKYAETIISFQEKYRPALIKLWKDCQLIRPWNDPNKDIERSLNSIQAKIFLMVEKNHDVLIGAIMVGYDGHRGSVNYLAVSPDKRKSNYGRRLMLHCEEYLLALGCPKLNLMVRSSNTETLAFYRKLEYSLDEVAVLSKRLILDD